MPREPFASVPDVRDAAEADSGYSAYLVRLTYWNGSSQTETKFTDAPMDLSVDVGGGLETWIGTGLLMSVSDVTEGSDMDVGGLDLVFDGVNQTVIAIIMSNDFRGQPISVYKVWINASDGTVAGTPALLFSGYQNDPYTICESSTDESDAVSVSTRATNRLTATRSENVVLTNPEGHLSYIQRSGLTDFTANFWVLVPQISGLEIYWGELNPNRERHQPEWERATDQAFGR